jgi:hypothetical protein
MAAAVHPKSAQREVPRRWMEHDSEWVGLLVEHKHSSVPSYNAGQYDHQLTGLAA